MRSRSVKRFVAETAVIGLIFVAINAVFSPEALPQVAIVVAVVWAALSLAFYNANRARA